MFERDPVPAGHFWYRQVRFASGRLTIGALLSRPPGEGPFPAYIHNHGSMTRERAAGRLWSLSDELDFSLVRAGFVVLRPARRGYLGSGGQTTTYFATLSKVSAREVVSAAYDEADDVRAGDHYRFPIPELVRFLDRRLKGPAGPRLDSP